MEIDEAHSLAEQSPEDMTSTRKIGSSQLQIQIGEEHIGIANSLILKVDGAYSCFTQ